MEGVSLLRVRNRDCAQRWRIGLYDMGWFCVDGDHHHPYKKFSQPQH
jgi:hypothetical protein